MLEVSLKAYAAGKMCTTEEKYRENTKLDYWLLSSNQASYTQAISQIEKSKQTLLKTLIWKEQKILYLLLGNLLKNAKEIFLNVYKVKV